MASSLPAHFLLNAFHPVWGLVLEHAVVSRVSERVLFGGETSIELPGFVDFADSGDSLGSVVAALIHGQTAAPIMGTVAIRIAFG